MEARSLAILALIFAAACSDDTTETEPDPVDQPVPGDPDFVRDPALDVELHSAASSNASHEPGNNCMHCHQRLGGGPGLFTAAGTLFDPAGQPRTGAVVEIRTAPAGEGDLLAAIEVDQLGNFYTTADLPIPESELFPFVRGSTTTKEMPFPTSSLACNYCHTPVLRVSLDGP
jgi:hypothetical protein